MVAQAKLVRTGENFRFISEASLKQSPKIWSFKEGFKFDNLVNIHHDSGKSVAELMTTGGFNAQFFNRMEYEVEAGRKEVPLLYEDIYDIRADANYPKNIDIYTYGPGGVAFNLTPEGKGVQYATVGEGSKTIAMQHYSVGLQYTEDMFIYSQTWMFPELERDFGAAYNALLNHIHLSPIITATYTGNNVTNGTTLTSFGADTTIDLAEKYLRTVEQAIADSVDDADNPRYGPYIILASTIDAIRIARALMVVPQQGISKGMPMVDGINTIEAVIAYNGWSGTRGKEATTYSGVPAGTAYLVDISNKRHDFLSRVKHGLRRQMGGADITKFVLDNVVWDTRFAAYANPVRAVQKITLPTLTDGAA